MRHVEPTVTNSAGRNTYGLSVARIGADRRLGI